MGSEDQSSSNRKCGAMRLDAGEEWDGSLQVPSTHRSSLLKSCFVHFRNIGYKGGVAQSRSVEARGTAGNVLK